MQGHRRYKGFLNAQAQMGVEFSGDAVIWFTTEDLDIIFSEDYDKIFMKRIENFSALICYNDQIALRVLDVFRRNGIKVPEDISIVSFDDSDLAQATEVKLTTIAHPHSELGEKAAGCLLDMIMQKRKNIYEIIQPKLTIRQSTKNIYKN
jgi:GntR family transcriptional regulator of arabinose operon